MPKGTRTFARLIMRRDRIKLPLQIVLFIGTLLAIVPLLKDVYGDDDSLRILYETFSANPAGLFLTGPIDAPTFGSLITLETLLWWGLALAFMNTLLVVRHTRQNEEMGAQELLLSGQASRYAGISAVLLVAFVLNIVIALGVGVGFALLEPSWSVSQSMLYGVALGAFGMAWAAIATVFSQLFNSSRTTNGMLAAAIGLAFVLRGIGDFTGDIGSNGLSQPTWPSWLSPFGWMQQVRPLTFPEYWPLWLPFLCAAVSIGLAYLLVGKRDVGEGVLPARKGNTRASWILRRPLGLVLYLQKNVFIGWLVGVVVMGVTIGALVPEMSAIYNDSEELRVVLEAIGGHGDVVSSFLSAMLAIVVVMVVAYGIHGVSKLRAEEATGHLENILATKLSRVWWLISNFLMVNLAGVLMLGFVGLLMAFTANLIGEFQVNVTEYLVAGFSYAPLLLFFTSVYVALFGIIPRLAGLVTWTYFGLVAFILWIGPILRLSDWIMDLSPMTHMASPPAQGIDTAPLTVLATASVILFLIGLLAWRQRDIA